MVIGPWIALLAFWCLLAGGLLSGELDLRHGLLFVLIWLAGNLTLQYLSYSAFFPTYVALIDVVLTLMIFKGDVRLS